MIFTTSLIPEFFKCALVYSGMLGRYLLPGNRLERAMPQGRAWWQKPGLGLVYQVETRPGWEWDRDYTRFNASLMDEKGRFKFNGPFPQIPQWVDFSARTAGVDYHVLELKWHDGICYFNTQLTEWKTKKDYAKEFAELSRAAAIPFLYYYSGVFDHNPQFDTIQPDRTTTPSFIGLRPEPDYIDYLVGHYQEIVDQYNPDGMWIDWYWADRSAKATVNFFRRHAPQTAIAYNLSNYFASAHDKVHFTSGEAHTLHGPWVELRTESSGVKVPVFSNTWKWANLNRALFHHPWEVITPAGKWWQDPSLRDDPLDLVRMAAIVMACGGKICPGMTAQMDGTIYPDQIKQLTMLGDWYKPRKDLFVEAAPLRYRLARVPGVTLDDPALKTICSRQESDYLLHLINLTSRRGGVTVKLDQRLWPEVKAVILEPNHTPLAVRQDGQAFVVTIAPADIDQVDTILRIIPSTTTAPIPYGG